MFFAYRVRLTRIVNQQLHDRLVSKLGPSLRGCVKYPPAFDLDVLFDDQESVERQGRRFGFRAVRIDPDDDRWAQRVLQAVS